MMAKEYFRQECNRNIIIIHRLLETRKKLDAFLDSNRRDCPHLDLTLMIFANADVVLYKDVDILVLMSRCLY